MTFRRNPTGRTPPGRGHARPALGLLLVAGLLAGCANGEGLFAGLPGTAPAAVPASVPAGPPQGRPGVDVAIFAAAHQPGTPGMVFGQPARVGRVYSAASGRECREVIIGTGTNERAAVACLQPDGTYGSTRPLLRGALR